MFCTFGLCCLKQHTFNLSYISIWLEHHNVIWAQWYKLYPNARSATIKISLFVFIIKIYDIVFVIQQSCTDWINDGLMNCYNYLDFQLVDMYWYFTTNHEQLIQSKLCSHHSSQCTSWLTMINDVLCHNVNCYNVYNCLPYVNMM